MTRKKEKKEQPVMMFSLVWWEGVVVQVAFLVLHKVSPLENALTEVVTLRKFVFLALYTERPLINIHCNHDAHAAEHTHQK